MTNKETVEEKNEKFIENLINKKQSRSVNEIHDKSLSIGDKLADKIAAGAGSWPFIITFLLIIAIWITFNVSQMFIHFDNYPFILLNLALSCIAALQAPIIMMSQNRQEERDRIRNQQDFETNVKAEILIEEILKYTKKIEQVERKQNEILEYLKNK
ncbi:MAG: DUF1003 domain-containing protein [Clostridia bacterium]|nr:DUF1003 domain-containing protein [Clostridia bacterium]MDD4386158.1 DUF1003 domain-containing protein [Clostridia bacterium]